ncbi:increased DNA methylation 2 isoform X2 [Carya illinoinensis]|uniref:SHSP domain-containing protein n=1 Tax=Carya illinoinensis TaxID=32201 RepID=A0A8T1Q1P1_CARIL|nr:increased DNA methylation 2 isoform X2 [Carya illinoinensis]KAG6646560.1 hypothetical protein CIPAW_07G015900 [Carya illinoinensis]
MWGLNDIFVFACIAMDDLPQATEPLTAARVESNNEQSGIPDDNRLFLLYFIMGTYFGPDLKGEGPRMSLFQRIAEGLPPYTLDQVAGTHMKTVEVEQVYYYVLRKAAASVVVKLPLLHQFLEGNVPVHGQDPSASYPQFPDLFPPQLHPLSQLNNRYKIIHNIIFISNPETFYIKLEDTERFKRLTGLKNLLLYRDSARLNTSTNCGPMREAENRELTPNRSSHCSKRTRRLDDLLKPQDSWQHRHVVAPVSSVPYNAKSLMYSYMAPLPSDDDSETVDVERVGPAIIILPSHPTKKEWTNIVAATKSGLALTGSAATGQVGPVIGLMDIGECEDSYLFRVSLPGVKRDEREFSCEIESDGEVLIRGVTTTGEKTVHRYSQVFEMQTHNLCPPGHFSISFQLPGPVDPQQFSGNFGTDGILEGIVMKGSHKR